MKSLNLSQFKKMKEDKKTVTMGHPTGHTITIFKNKLPALQRKLIEKLPVHMADGGDTEQSSEEQPVQSAPPPQQQSGGWDVFNDIGKGIHNFTSGLANVQVPELVGAPSQSKAAEIGPQSPAEEPVKQQEATNPVANPQAEPVKQKVNPNDVNNLNLGDVYKKELAGINHEASAKATLAEDQGEVERQHQQDLQIAENTWAKTNQDMQKHLTDTLSDIKNSHINPNHFLENMGTGQKIATAIGLLFGGFTGGFNRTGVNPAANWLNEQINRDVEAQKLNQSNKMNVYNGYLDQYKNAHVADQMARATQYGIYASKIREAANNSGSDIAKAAGEREAANLEQKIIPLVQNAHLMQNISQFNGSSGQPGTLPGSEAQYKTILNSAQTINPDMYKDAQSKYVPGVGVASHPVDSKDSERLGNINELMPLIDRALADQKKFGNSGAWSVKNRADAAADLNSINVSLNKLTGLNRLNDHEYQNYGKQIGNIGGINAGGTLETIKRLKQQADSDRNSMMTSMGIKPFSDAGNPSGLNQQQQNNLNIFMKNNPSVDQGTAINVLRQKGLI